MQVEALLREISNSSADNSTGSDPRSTPAQRQTLTTGQPPVGSPLQPRSNGSGGGGRPLSGGVPPGGACSLGVGDNAFSNGGGFSFGGGALGAAPPRPVSDLLGLLF